MWVAQCSKELAAGGREAHARTAKAHTFFRWRETDMPIVRVDDKGDQVKNRNARIVGIVAGVTVLAGVVWFVTDPEWGLFTMLLGNSLASVWNLADDS